jgi:hypothetical protein
MTDRATALDALEKAHLTILKELGEFRAEQQELIKKNPKDYRGVKSDFFESLFKVYP